MSFTPPTSPHDPQPDTPLVYETHMHTTLCKHAEGDLWEYCERAIVRGLAGITVTCHCPMPEGHSSHVRMEPSQFDDYLALVEQAREAYAGRLDVRLGMECDFFPGYEDHIEQLLWRADFDFILGSVHPQLPEYREAYWMGDASAFMHCYFEHLVQAAETGLFDSLAHPDLVKNMVGPAWSPGAVVPLVSNYLDRIARTGVCMELNTSGNYKIVREMNPSVAMLRAMRQRDIPVTVGADAHQAWRVADLFEEAYDALREAGYSDVCLFTRRERYEIGIDAAYASLRSDHPDALDGSSTQLEALPG
ncbi:MAG: histidinol-phosphatase [Planctomycetota bacterium]